MQTQLLVHLASFSLLTLCLLSCKPQANKSSEKSTPTTEPLVYTIAFGSCADQNHPLPIFHEVVRHNPDIFVFLGDNIYGDTNDMDVLSQKYSTLGKKPSYKALKENTEIIATWDDHDYGRNDAGKEYPHKEASKEVFLKFFEEPNNSERYKHEGIYTSVIRHVGDKTVQFLILDGRTFRDKLKQANKIKSFYRWDYEPHIDTSTSLLGETQWKWLETELSKPADFRVVVSGSQFGIEANGYESWANFPHERHRFIQLVKKTKANHIVIISGDVHYAEISKFSSPQCYPIYDITASGLSKKWHFATPNTNRIEGPVMENHFGLLTINFSNQIPHVKAEIWDGTGNQRIEYTIPLEHISFNDHKPAG